MTYTHTAKFYGLPVLVKFIGDGCEIVMRWTKWFWPVSILSIIHQQMNDLYGTDYLFKLSDVREIK